MSNPLLAVLEQRAGIAPIPAPADLLGQMAARGGITLEELAAGVEGPTKAEEPSRHKAVFSSPELDRIMALPRRHLDHEALALIETLTAALRSGTGDQRLRPIQALSLAEMCEIRGGFFPVVAGGGKTIISYLSATMLNARRPLLLVPAALRDKTRREFRELAKHWDGPHPDAIRVESYELLSRPEQGKQLGPDGRVIREEFLVRFQPDLIIMDEAHKVKDPKTAVCKRLRRYLKERPVPVVAMSGTMTKRSIKDYAHIAEWCMRDLTPLPRRFMELDTWARCLDDKVDDRAETGALVKLMSEEEKELALEGPEEELAAVRSAFRRRLTETPGCVATADGEVEGVELHLIPLDPGGTTDCPEINAKMALMRSTWETPDAWPIADGIAMWRHARELALGFHYVWDPRPPPEWMAARAAWAQWCREVLKHNRRGVDTEKQVKDAVDAGVYRDDGLLAAWRAIEPTFEPNTIPVWHSTEALDHAAEWLAEHDGIVWTEHTHFAKELAKRSGKPYFGRQGKDAKGRPIELHSGPCIASISSNGTGRNLQAWDRNLIMSLPQSPLTVEQLLARTHRPGQTSSAVKTWIYCGGYEHIAGYWLARQGAEYQKRSLGSAQRLLYSHSDSMPRLEEIKRRAGARWRR